MSADLRTQVDVMRVTTILVEVGVAIHRERS